MLAAGPLHHLGAVSDQAGTGDVTGTSPPGRLGVGQCGLGKAQTKPAIALAEIERVREG